MDHRGEMLRTQAVQACLGALSAHEVHVYGEAPGEWHGTILHSDDMMSSTTHWATPEGKFRYEVVVRVEVTRRRIDG